MELKPDSVFTGLEQASQSTGISIDLLRRCKVHPDGVDGSNGFHQSGRIYWAKLKPWLEEHEEELTTGNADEYFKWRSLKMEAQAKLASIELEEKRKQLTPKQEVTAILRRVMTAQSSILESKFRTELVPKMEGLSEGQRQILMDSAIQEYMSILRTELSKWEKK